MQSVKNALYFSGMWLHNLSASTSYPEIARFADGHIVHGYDSPETTVSFDVFGERQIRYWGEMGHRGCDGNFGILGKGWICKGCGDYNPSGCAVCLKCNAPAIQGFVKPLQFNFYVAELQQETIRFAEEDMSPTRIDLSCDGDNVVEALHTALFTDQQFFKANGYDLQSGYYLCQYCGFGVPEGMSCPGCAGKRLPFSEIVKLNRKCVYCGRESLGNLVCVGCGARIKGTTFKQARLVS